MRDEQFPSSEFETEGYRAVTHGQKAWNGVAILAKEPAAVRQVGLPGQEEFGARMLTADVQGLSFTTVYVPNGKTLDHPDFERKLTWLDTLARHFRECHDPYVPTLLCGDFNEGSQGAISQMLQQQTTMQDYNTQWTDLAVLAYSALGQSPPSTLISNIDSSEGTLDGESSDRRFDRIYLRANDKAEPRVSGAGLFGMGSNGRMIVPSDHYGVYVDIDWNEEA